MKTNRFIHACLAALALAAPSHAVVISYDYDAAGRLTGVNYGGTSNTTYAYDKNGSLLSRVTSTNPLPPLAANYTGLITNAIPGITNTGAISLKLLPSGGFTGKFVIGGTTFMVKGTFAADGTTPDIVIARKAPLAALTLHLALDVNGGTNQITGTITDGTFTSQLALDRAAYDKKLNPLPSGSIGAYTVLFQPTQASATIPQGNGFGMAKVDAAGGIKLSATLADGAKIAQSATLSSAATWPLYLSLYKGGGQFAGLVTFASDPGVSDFAGTLDWRKPATNTALYPVAFATQLDVVGSKYIVPPKGQGVLALAATANNARLVIGGPAPLDKLITLDAANKVSTPADTTKLKLTLAAPTGIFLGSYTDGIKTFKFGGVIFQEQNIGGGFVTGATETGAVSIGQP
jgi:YD repeat-containing protein